MYRFGVGIETKHNVSHLACVLQLLAEMDIIHNYGFIRNEKTEDMSDEEFLEYVNSGHMDANHSISKTKKNKYWIPAKKLHDRISGLPSFDKLKKNFKIYIDALMFVRQEENDGKLRVPYPKDADEVYKYMVEQRAQYTKQKVERSEQDLDAQYYAKYVDDMAPKLFRLICNACANGNVDDLLKVIVSTGLLDIVPVKYRQEVANIAISTLFPNYDPNNASPEYTIVRDALKILGSLGK